MNIPVLKIEGETFPEVWEKSIVEVWENGIDIKTEYDKPEDPPSKDASVILVINDPLKEPRLHKGGLCGGYDDLEKYRLEVLSGVRDHWVNPQEGKWEYTYSQRLTNYSSLPAQNKGEYLHWDSKRVNQMEKMYQKVKECGYTRRAQSVTWDANIDMDVYDPPCFCAGTKISTPIGSKNIEDLQNGDLVYAYDLNDNVLVENKVKKYFSKTKKCVQILTSLLQSSVSEDQLIYTDSGWKKARELTENNKIKVSSICSAADISDMMILGFLHGDGWLGRHYDYSVNFSIHPDADALWTQEWIRERSNNKLYDETRFCENKKMDIGGQSRKIHVCDKKIYEHFEKMGAPISYKKGQFIKLEAKEMSTKECQDFLTGLYSAEGCVYFRPNDETVNIELGMCWKECVDFVEEILIKLNIPHSCYNYNGVYKILINTNHGVKEAIEHFDFRMDSRKQSKYYKMKASFNASIKLWEQKQAAVETARTMSSDGESRAVIYEKIPQCHQRWFDSQYKPAFRITINSEIECFDSYIMLPVDDVVDIGEERVYDFEIQHSDHAIVADGIVAHNCLQRFWIRLLNNTLNWNTHFRSNDAFKAAFMNIWAFIEWQKEFAERLSEDLGREIKMGRMMHVVDSYHIYSSYFHEVKAFLDSIEARGEERFAYSDDENVQYSFEYGRETMLKEKEKELQEGIISEARYNELVELVTLPRL